MDDNLDTPVICLYCPSREPATGDAHVVAEAIYPGGPVLPRGAICTPCNNYFGTKLEPMLLRHPYIGLPLQFLRVPGKRGHQRQGLGIFEVTDRNATAFPVSVVGTRIDQDGTRVATISVGPWLDPHFDLDVFRRGLHLIAFNYFALHHGLAVARNQKFQDVRRYIRASHRNERWPFVQDSLAPDPFIPEIGPRFITRGTALIVGVRIFNTDYYVDLLNTGSLVTFQIGWRGGRPVYLGKELKAYPRPETQDDRPYRVEMS